MVTTERLYYTDSHLIEFDARVVDVTERVSGWTAVTLDRTAFYPTGGGQPSDTGTLDGARVVECIDEGETVFHVIQGPTPAIGSTVSITFNSTPASIFCHRLLSRSSAYPHAAFA